MERMEISKTHFSRIPDDDEVGRWLLSTYFADMYFCDGSNFLKKNIFNLKPNKFLQSRNCIFFGKRDHIPLDSDENIH